MYHTISRTELISCRHLVEFVALSMSLHKEFFIPTYIVQGEGGEVPATCVFGAVVKYYVYAGWHNSKNGVFLSDSADLQLHRRLEKQRYPVYSPPV